MSPAEAAAAMIEKPVIVIGAGGHAKVVLDTLRRAGVPVYGLCDRRPDEARVKFPGETILDGDDNALAMSPRDVVVTVGVGSIRADNVRARLFQTYRRHGFSFLTLIHPSAIVADGVEIGEGAQIMAGAVIQPGTHIGMNAVINTRASIDHDCRIGDHAFVSPGAVLCGGVEIGEGAHVGAGATVIEYRRVGAGATVAAGAAVVEDVAPNALVGGVPARVPQGGRRKAT
jgi:UDP-perosamine 4-acetyltransferase